ncbi:hypothetical protein HK413_02770 [Mucilaginibacter sp. S1162]|uniref:SusD-like N-terminal domain-containing protein n=1 Tax=Mucilaginibacter humi TaxID=2732510 RepID=A0ABX1W097_9SPHI|nr:hypothetical protein [Mucilaginibacter humi]NNU33353.1 hypothetical protein [Mucilaginibacter humi]
MSKLITLNSFFISVWLPVSVSACNNSGDPLINKQPTHGYTSEINKLIAAGSRVESTSNDSLQLIAARLYEINKASDSKQALVYAELFETKYYWQGADHKKAMTTP